jgi:hypothetical protein
LMRARRASSCAPRQDQQKPLSPGTRTSVTIVRDARSSAHVPNDFALSANRLKRHKITYYCATFSTRTELLSLDLCRDRFGTSWAAIPSRWGWSSAPDRDTGICN